MIFYFKANKGLIDWDNKRSMFDFLLQNDGKKFVANINLDKARRSLDQNSLYFLYLDIISRETGHTSEELHRIFKGLFLPKKKVTLNGKDYMLTGSTTELNKVDFGIYLDRICAETNIPIPDKKVAGDVINYPTNNGQTPTF